MTRLRIAIALVLLVAVGVIVWQAVKPSDEPVYQGKTLTSWLESYVRYNQSGDLIGINVEAEEVVRQIGSNAIPTLLRLLRRSDPPWKARLMELRQRFFRIRVPPARYWSIAADDAFFALGTNAASAVPALIEIAEQNISPESRRAAIRSLGYVGPAAKQAIPNLLQWATSTDRDLRNCARSALRQVAPAAAAKLEIANPP